MSDESMKHGHSGHEVEFEREDLGTRAVFVFMIGLAIFGVVTYFIVVAMYSFSRSLRAFAHGHRQPAGHFEGSDVACGHAGDMDKAFKDNGAPMLETNERGQFRDFLMNQEKQLRSYGWVDEKDGVARIPIERAMELIVQRGLPVYPQGSADAKTKTAMASKAPAPSAGKGKSSVQ